MHTLMRMSGRVDRSRRKFAVSLVWDFCSTWSIKQVSYKTKIIMKWNIFSLNIPIETLLQHITKNKYHFCVIYRTSHTWTVISYYAAGIWMSQEIIIVLFCSAYFGKVLKASRLNNGLFSMRCEETLSYLFLNLETAQKVGSI